MGVPKKKCRARRIQTVWGSSSQSVVQGTAMHGGVWVRDMHREAPAWLTDRGSNRFVNFKVLLDR